MIQSTTDLMMTRQSISYRHDMNRPQMLIIFECWRSLFWEPDYNTCF
jgi:hypothetical protein